MVQDWQEGELDKSLPVCEAPPEDLEGLVPVAVKVMHPGMAQAFRCAAVCLILNIMVFLDLFQGGHNRKINLLQMFIIYQLLSCSLVLMRLLNFVPSSI